MELFHWKQSYFEWRYFTFAHISISKNISIFQYANDGLKNLIKNKMSIFWMRIIMYWSFPGGYYTSWSYLGEPSLVEIVPFRTAQVGIFQAKIVLLPLMFWDNTANFLLYEVDPEVAVQRCSWEKVFRKYAANLQENTHVELWFYWNHTSVWVFSSKFAAYFWNIYS